MQSSAGAKSAIQTKLTVNAPGDRYEREADTVAGAVMSHGSSIDAAQNPRGLGLQRQEDDSVQRMEEESVQRREDDSIQRMEEESVQRQEDDSIQRMVDAGDQDPRSIQREPSAGSVPSVTPLITETIERPGTGRPIDPGNRSRIESVLSADLGDVRLHDDRRANLAAKGLKARAFTHGSHIFLSRPSLAGDTELLAHESTHSVQQGAVVQRQPDEVLQRKEEDAVQRQPAVSTDGQAPGVQRLFFLIPLVVGGAAVADYATDGGVRRSLKKGAWWAFKQVAPAALVRLVEEIKAAGGLWAYLKQAIFGIVDEVYDMVKAVASIPAKIVKLIQSLLLIFGLALKLIPALASGNKKKIFDGVRDIARAMSEVVTIIWPGVRFVLEPISKLVSGFFRFFGFVLKGAARVIGTVVSIFTKYIGRAIELAGDAVEWVLDKALDIDADLNTEAITRAIEEAGEALVRPIRDGLTAMGNFVSHLGGMITIETFDALIEDFKKFLSNAASFADNMDSEGEGSGIVTMHEVLKGITEAIRSLFDIVGTGIIRIGKWIADKVGWLTGKVAGVFATMARIPGIPEWVEDGLNAVRDAVFNFGITAQATINASASLIAMGIGKIGTLAAWVFKIVVQVALTVASDPLKVLTSFFGVLKKLWELVPAFIREPVQDFIENQVKERIPLVAEFIAVAKLVGKVTTLLGILIIDMLTKFALWGPLKRFFRTLIDVIGFPIDLVKQIILKAMALFGAIVRHPIRFLRNIFRAVKAGFTGFFKNIQTHLLKGVLDWLFAVARKNNIEPPKSLELSELFRFAFEVMGINEDLIFERLGKHKDVGKEKAQKIRKIYKTLSGAWEWISKLFTQGPGAIWEDIKAKLSELKNKLVNNVLEWVMGEFVDAMLAKLLTWLDPTGIMAIINSAVAIYRAIQSFIEHIKEMLQIVNSVLDSVGELVAGKIEKAAEMIELNLVRALPIVISFLANQFGLRDIGSRIGEIVKKVREYVVTGIDWLIDKAVKAGGVIVKAAKSAAAKVLEFFDKPFSIKGSGEKHTVRAEVRENAKTEFLIASESFNSLLQTIRDVGEEHIKYYNDIGETEKASAIQADFASIASSLISHGSKRGRALENATAKVAKDFNAILAKHDIRTLHDTAFTGFPEEHSPDYGDMDDFGRASYARVTLSIRSRKFMRRTNPEATVSGMNIKRGYHRGHLLAASLGGSNTNRKNFAPMSATTNTSRSGMVIFEHALRQALKSNEAGGPPPYIVKYSLTAQYAHDMKGLQSWLSTTFPGAHEHAARDLFNLAKNNTDLTHDELHKAIDGGSGAVTKTSLRGQLTNIKDQLALHFMPNRFVPDIEVKQGANLKLPNSQSFNNHQ